MRQQIDTLAQQLASLDASITQLESTLPAKEPVYVGSTKTTTTGRIADAGKTGLLAANSLCATEFASKAQMCTQFQLPRTLALGRLKPTDRIAPAWIYMPTWHNPGGGKTEPLAGLADNCGGYTTGDDTAGWTGMAV